MLSDFRVLFWGVFFFGITCLVFLCIFSSFLHLGIYIYLDPQAFLLLLFLFSPPPYWWWGERARSCVAAQLLAVVNWPHSFKQFFHSVVHIFAEPLLFRNRVQRLSSLPKECTENWFIKIITIKKNTQKCEKKLKKKPHSYDLVCLRFWVHKENLGNLTLTYIFLLKKQKDKIKM